MQADGFLPARIHANGATSTDTFAWPVIAQSAAAVLQRGASTDFASFALPRLARYLGHALDRFEKDGHYVWRTPEEAFIPDTFDLDLATVDLAAFLLSDLDAFCDLCAAYEYNDPAVQTLQAQRDGLVAHLTDHLWDGDTGVFRDRYVNGKQIKRTTLSTYLPLLWKGLGSAYREQVFRHMREQSAKTGNAPADLWERWDADPVDPPAPAQQEAYVLYALYQTDDSGIQRQFQTALNNALQFAYNKHGMIPADLSGAVSDPSGSSVNGAALVVMVTHPPSASRAPADTSSQTIRWLDRYRVAVVGALMGALVIAITAVVLTYLFKATPTAVDMETLTGLAERHYADGRYEQAIAIYHELTDAMPGNVGLHFRLGNAYYRAGQLAQAEQHYQRALDSDRPHPRAMRNLAITLYDQGKYDEAASYFQMIIDRFGDHYPTLANQAQLALDIMQPRLSAGDP